MDRVAQDQYSLTDANIEEYELSMMSELYDLLAPRWVSGLPKKTRGCYSDSFILLMEDHETIKIGYYDFDKDKWSAEEYSTQKVLKYMPLPTPSKEKP